MGRVLPDSVRCAETGEDDLEGVADDCKDDQSLADDHSDSVKGVEGLGQADEGVGARSVPSPLRLERF